MGAAVLAQVSLLLLIEGISLAQCSYISLSLRMRGRKNFIGSKEISRHQWDVSLGKAVGHTDSVLSIPARIYACERNRVINKIQFHFASEVMLVELKYTVVVCKAKFPYFFLNSEIQWHIYMAAPQNALRYINDL